MVIDSVYRGLNSFLSGTFKEWKNATVGGPTTTPGPLSPFGAMVATGAGALAPGVIGRLATSMAGAVVLSATTGTPAAASPATLTTTYSMLAENFDVKWMLEPKHRVVPWRMRNFPYDAGSGVIKFFVVT